MALHIQTCLLKDLCSQGCSFCGLATPRKCNSILLVGPGPLESCLTCISYMLNIYFNRRSSWLRLSEYIQNSPTSRAVTIPSKPQFLFFIVNCGHIVVYARGPGLAAITETSQSLTNISPRRHLHKPQSLPRVLHVPFSWSLCVSLCASPQFQSIHSERTLPDRSQTTLTPPSEFSNGFLSQNSSQSYYSGPRRLSMICTSYFSGLTSPYSSPAGLFA